MTDLATLKVGAMVWTRGTNEFGDQRTGGCIVGVGVDRETGERVATLITNSPTTPRQPSLYLIRRNKHEPLGLIARLVRVPVGDIDPAAHDDHRDHRQVWGWAKRALVASTLAPNDHFGTKGHDDLITAYRTLRAEAQTLNQESMT